MKKLYSVTEAKQLYSLETMPAHKVLLKNFLDDGLMALVKFEEIGYRSEWKIDEELKNLFKSFFYESVEVKPDHIYSNGNWGGKGSVRVILNYSNTYPKDENGKSVSTPVDPKVFEDSVREIKKLKLYGISISDYIDTKDSWGGCAKISFYLPNFLKDNFLDILKKGAKTELEKFISNYFDVDRFSVINSKSKSYINYGFSSLFEKLLDEVVTESTGIPSRAKLYLRDKSLDISYYIKGTPDTQDKLKEVASKVKSSIKIGKTEFNFDFKIEDNRPGNPDYWSIYIKGSIDLKEVSAKIKEAVKEAIKSGK